MADYPNRPAELLKVFEEKQKDATSKASAGGPAVNTTTWSFFEQRLKEYIDWRDKVLVDGLPLVKAGNDATGRDTQGKWTDYFKNKGSEAFQKVQKFLNNPDPTLQPLVETMCAQESTFFSMIADMPMALFQGEIREDIKGLKQSKVDWVREWANLIGLDKQRDEDYKRFRQTVMEESNKVMGNLLGYKKKLEDFQEHVLPKVIETVVGLGVGIVAEKFGIGEANVKFLEDGINVFMGNFLELINGMKPSIEDYVKTAERLSYDRRTILRVFAAKIKEVKWVTARYNPDLVVKRYEEQAAKAREFAGKAGSTPQVEDAKKLAEKIITESKPAVDDFKTCYNDFYSALDGIFVGQISESTREQLAEAGYMQSFFDDFRKMDMYPGFQDSLKDVAMVMDVSLDKMQEGSRRGLKDYLRMRFAPLEAKLKELGSGIFDRFGVVLQSHKNAALDILK